MDWNAILDSGYFWGGLGLVAIVVGTFFFDILNNVKPAPKEKKKK